MNVRFDFSIEDLVDAGERMLTRSSVIRGLRRSSAVFAAAVVATILFFWTPGPPATRLIIAVISAAGAWFIYVPIRKALVARRLRDYWKERLKGEGPFSCEVELTGEGVTARQFSTVTSVPWSEVSRVEAAADSVEIWTRSGGIIVVRDRAFSSPEEKRRFVELGSKSAAASANAAPA